MRGLALPTEPSVHRDSEKGRHGDKEKTGGSAVLHLLLVSPSPCLLVCPQHEVSPERAAYARRFAAMARCIAVPMSAGLSATTTPASSSAATFSRAVPLPPEMIAPACPMRLPGGAVRPAMNAATGFVTFCLMYAAACSSALPPISPIMRMASVCGSA